MHETLYRKLTNVAAETLAPMLNCKVNAYGTDKTIENKDTLYILQHLDEIKSKAKGAQGSQLIGEDSETGEDTNLEWVKKP
jgi:hypothetical protein